MRIIDARSGEDMQIGRTYHYGDGEMVTLLSFRPGIFKSKMLVQGTHRDDRGQLVTSPPQWVTGPVRYMHPRFPGQRVTFFPS